MELEDSDEVQGLRGLQTNIFNRIFSSSVQTPVTPTPTRPEQPAAEQIARPPAVEQDSLNVEPHTSTLTERVKFTSAEQDTLFMPPIEDLPSTPPTSQDEGYGHGVSVNSMIVTPRVPTLLSNYLMWEQA